MKKISLSRRRLNTGAGPMRLPAMVTVCCMFVGVAATSTSAKDSSSDRSVCSTLSKSANAAEQVAACTRLITSKQWPDMDLARLYFDLGEAHRAAGEYDRAIADFSEAIRLDPKFAVAYVGRGYVWWTKGDLDRAIADYSEAIRLDPEDVSAYRSRGVAWHAKGDLDRAIADYSKAIRLDPKDSVAYNNRGASYREQGNLPQAMIDLNEAIRINPKFGRALFHRALVFERMGDRGHALTDLRRSLELDPKQQDARQALARIEAATNAPASPSPTNGANRYLVSIRNPDGSKYSGEVVVEADGDRYRVVRTIAGERSIGTGIEHEDFLAVAFRAGNKLALGLYAQENVGWTGAWGTDGSQKVSAESWQRQSATTEPTALTPIADLAGTYVISGTNPDSTTYAGDVVVAQAGDAYQVTWTVGSERLDGFGIGYKNVLAVVYGSGSAVRIALYSREAGGRLGVWLKDGNQQLGAERWARR